MIQHADKARLPVALPLEGGGLLVDTEVAWESYGHVDKQHAIVLLHDLCDSHRALGSGFCEGWGKALIGPNQAIPPHAGWVLSLNLLGSPFGSTSAAMMPLSSGGLGLTLEDLARAANAALRALGVQKARAIVGVGLGGMVALRAASLFPDLTSGVVTFGAALTLPLGLREGLGMSNQLVKAGSYRKARSDLMSWTHRREHLLHWHGGSEGMDAWKLREAEDFCGKFDARSWASLATAYSSADLKGSLDKMRCKALLVAGSHDDVAPPAKVRDAYHAVEAAGAQARYYELAEDRGHAFLLTDVGRMSNQLGEFFSSL